jgi:hypothetical protein
MTKELLSALLILTVVSASASVATTVTLVPIEESEPGSPSNPLEPSDEIVVLVTSDARLLALDCILTITGGPATIVDAMGCGDLSLPDYGWDPGYCFAPALFPPFNPTRAEIGAGNYSGCRPGVVGWFKLHCEGPGLVTVELTAGDDFGGSSDMNFQVPNIHGTLDIYQGSEPDPNAGTCWDPAECGGQPLGDASCDGNTGLSDLFSLKAHFGRNAPWTGNECCSDFNHDDSVNLGDLFILKANYGTTGLSPSTGNQNCPP